MKKILNYMKRHKLRIVLLGLFAVLLVVGFLGFRMLVKVGNIKYLYNYQHDTKGSLPVEQHLENKLNANVTTASAVQATLPSNWNISTKIQVDGKEVSLFTRTNPIYFTS